MSALSLDASPVSLFLDAARQWPGRIAARAFGVDGALTGEVSFADLSQAAHALAGDLHERFGPGARVALGAPNTIQHLTAWLAIQLAGQVWIPLNPANGPAANARIIARARPAVILASACQRAGLEGHGAPAEALDAPLPNPGFTPVLRRGEAAMAIKFTGGSTGEPKGVIQSCRCVMANMINMADSLPAPGQMVFLACAPLTHGASHFILPALGSGGRLILTHKPDPAFLLRLLETEGVTEAFLPPTLLIRLTAAAPGPVEAPALRRLIYSAAPLSPEALKRAQAVFGPRIAGLYGQTEAPMTVTAITETELADPALMTSVGRACALNELALLDPEGRAAAPGETGEVAVSGPLVMDGYLDDRERTGAVLSDGWLRTGDLGRLDARGYLFLTGRAGEMIISGGFNIHPGEVDAALLALPGVEEACAFSIPDPDWGERLEAAVSPCAGARLDPEDLRAALRRQLGPVKTPRIIHVVSALPRNPVGKITRAAVRDSVGSMAQGGGLA